MQHQVLIFKVEWKNIISILRLLDQTSLAEAGYLQLAVSEIKLHLFRDYSELKELNLVNLTTAAGSKT